MKTKSKCPNCGKETLEKIWNGINPEKCSNCGHQTKTMEIIY
jgi:ribosomal protein L37AE/L43A